MAYVDDELDFVMAAARTKVIHPGFTILGDGAAPRGKPNPSVQRK